jgi:dienelactone hydrolase
VKNLHMFCVIPVAILFVLSSKLYVQEAVENEITTLQTSTGVRFGLLGNKGPSPEPTLFMFGDTIEGTLTGEDFRAVAHVLGKKGYLSVSLDVPCHGMDAKASEPKDRLSCWRERLQSGDNFIASFMPKVSAVLDFLVEQGFTDPHRVGACGTSRGGFIALHFAASDPRVRCVFAFAPVTDLASLSEFAGFEGNPRSLRLTRSLALTNSAEKLAGLPIWLTIGNYDLRVSTDEAITFSRRVVEASIVANKPANLELHVMTNPDHSVPPNAAEAATIWVLKQMGI